MAATTPAISQQHAPVTRSADWMVLGLLVAALALAWAIRQQALFATETVSVGTLAFSVPANSMPLNDSDQFAVTTPNGLTIRAAELDAPPVGVEDPLALASQRALSQARAREMYRTNESQLVEVGGKPAGVLDYAYVESDTESFFASSLEIMHGYELLVGQGETMYVLTLEGPEAQWEETQALWARLLNSVELSEVPQ